MAAHIIVFIYYFTFDIVLATFAICKFDYFGVPCDVRSTVCTCQARIILLRAFCLYYVFILLFKNVL